MGLKNIAFFSLVIAVVSTIGVSQPAKAQLANYGLDLSGSADMTVSTYNSIKKGIEDGALDVPLYSADAKGRLVVKYASNDTTITTEEFTGDLRIKSSLVADLGVGFYFETVQVIENVGTARERVREAIRDRVGEAVRERVIIE